ncbi:MAG: MFS transporter [Verrucomicrobia bacterium]|nr:MFS transporter [Verrucomicrobiota bacterium]
MASVPQASPDSLTNTSTRSEQWATILECLSLPRELAFGYLGLLLFMMGDGVESGYLAHFLHGEGFSQGKVALLFTIYGAISAMAARYSGAIADVWGPRVAMLTGLLVWIVLQVIFLGFALPMASFHLIIIAYGLRGLGYPLFAYGFLVLVTNTTPPRRLASAVGWFWFAFSAGLPTLGSLVASLMIPAIGQYATLWCSLLVVIAGGLVALTSIPKKTRRPGPVAPGTQTSKAMLSGVFSSMSIAWKKPKTAIGCVVRMINTAPQFGFLVFLPTFFTTVVALHLSEWLQLLTYMFLSNIIANLLSGIVGDRLGWRQTVVFVGGVGCTITTLLLYYIPVAHRGNFALCVLVAMLYGATLAGYVPLTAIMPHLAPENKGAAISMLNLGAGLSALLGPAIVAIFLGPLGVEGVMWIFAGLYALSAVLTLFLTLPEETETGAIRWSGIGGAAFGGGPAAFGASPCLLAHPPAMAALAAEGDIDLVLFDLGGTIYDDAAYTRALLRAVHEINPEIEDHEFWAVYDAERTRASGSLRTAIANQFADGDRKRVTTLARRYWEYMLPDLYPDVKPTLRALVARFKLGLVANSGDAALKALRRDGLLDLFTVIALPDRAGVEKPNEKIFLYALEKAGIPADRTVHVGNRLESDVRPAQRLGMRAVWLLRGDAPPAPTLDQLAEPDAVITSLVGLPTALSRLTGNPQIGAEATISAAETLGAPPSSSRPAGV